MSQLNRILLVAAVVGALGSIDRLVPAADMTARQFTLVERATTDTVTDLGAKGDSLGDILTFANEIYD